MRNKMGIKSIGRRELTKKICIKANLPMGKKTGEYFTKKQLMHLLLTLDRIETR